jgi:hypothetical protein
VSLARLNWVRFVCALALAGATACGSSTSSPTADVISAGPYAVPSGYAFIDTRTPFEEVGDETLLDGGGYGAVAVVLADFDPRSDAGLLAATPPAGGHVLRIELVGPSYIGGAPKLMDGATPVAMSPGRYAVGFEGESDDDLGMLPTGTSALLDLFGFGDAGSYTQAQAVSGTVTLTTIASGHATGTFNVQIAPYAGSPTPSRIDPTSSVPFSGSFAATNL